MRKTIGDGVEVVIIRSALVDASRLRMMVPEVIHRTVPLTELFSVRAEVHFEDGSSLPIWTETFYLGAESLQVHAIEVEIGEVEVRPGRPKIPVGELVVALSDGGNWVMLHRQRVPSVPMPGHMGSEVKMFSSGDWHRSAKPELHPPARPEVVLTRDEEGLWLVELTHREAELMQRSLFRQINGKWEFELIQRERKETSRM